MLIINDMRNINLKFQLLLIALHVPIYTVHCETAWGEARTETFCDSNTPIGLLQVWDIAYHEESSDKIFFATNAGLGVYDGMRWEIYRGSGSSILRALEYDRNSKRILSAGVNDFGYWTETDTGHFEYTSIYSNKEFRSKSEEFWRVAICNGHYWFQCREKIIITDCKGNITDTLSCKDHIKYMYEADGEIFYQDGDELIHYNGTQAETIGHFNDRIINIIRLKDKLILALEHEGLFAYRTGGTVELNRKTNKELSKAKINRCVKIDDRRMIVSSTKSGYFIINDSGEVLQSGQNNRDISKSTALCAKADNHGNIWLGLDSGVAFIESGCSDTYLSDSRLGQVHNVCRLDNGDLLISSNKGLFVHNRTTLKQEALTGSVWNIQKFQNNIYLAHDQGLFLYKPDGSLQKISGRTGYFGLSQTCNPDKYIAATYTGLELFHKDSEGILRFHSAIDGYKGYTRKIAIDQHNKVWVCVNGDGFVSLSLSDDMTKVIDSINHSIECEHNSTAFPFTYKGKLTLCCGNHAYDIDGENLITNIEVEEIMLLCGGALKTLCESDGKIWYLSDSGIGYIDFPEEKPERHAGMLAGIIGERISSNFSIMDGYMAIGYLNGIAFTSGTTSRQADLKIRHITSNGVSQTKAHNIHSDGIKVPNNMNTIRIFIEGIPNDRMLMYRLRGRNSKWTYERIDNYIQFASLPAGSNTLEIKIPGNSDSYLRLNVSVGLPWYASVPMLIIYALTLSLVIIAIRRHYKLQEKHRINEIQQQGLLESLRSKEKELANTTMMSNRRNALLSELKADASIIHEASSLSETKSVAYRLIRKINDALDDDSAWKQSEEYFNTIYDGLLDRLMEKYPKLTKTDLKLCVYIKLNMSTKEIAEMMSISPRSVEMARYRLRKKLGLSPEESIMSVLK